jgi:hypothetical protein
MVKIKKSKPIGKIVKGDNIKVDGKAYEVDAHYVLIDHGTTKEMAIEVFDPKAKEGEGEGQIRYFDDQIEETMGFFLMKEIMYEGQEIEKVEW